MPGLLKKKLRRYFSLYLLFIPVLLYYFIYRWQPMFYAIILSFTKFSLRGGIFGSKWVGFANIQRLFASYDFTEVLLNTMEIALLRVVIGFIPPILLAILLHDLKYRGFVRVSQTLLYIPHFFSWVVVFGIAWAFFATGSGMVNHWLTSVGKEPIEFLMSPRLFRPLIIGTALWKELGWGTIIYLASLSTIDPGLYEAAAVDGAGPLRRIWHITLPELKPIMVFILTISMGSILYAGGEQILLFYNPATYGVGDVIDTWVYRRGLLDMDFSLASAAGLFQSCFGLLFVLAANKAARRFAGIGLW